MDPKKEKLPLDARLLGDALIELNISRRNVAIYPKGHPSVEASLNRAYGLLQKLFKLRPEITLSVAKDTIIIDDYYLDKNNPVYREFALQLNGRGIASVSFQTGLSIDELYRFHKILSEKSEYLPRDVLLKRLRDDNFIHISIVLIDYDSFSFKKGKAEDKSGEKHLWERYIYGLLEGTLQTEELSDTLNDIPPETLAALLNGVSRDDFSGESYDRVITSYMKRTSERVFSGGDLKKLMNLINSLHPELKKQFLSSAVKNISRDTVSAEKALRDTPVEKIIELLSVINEQKIAVPEALKNLLDKFSRLRERGFEDLRIGNNLLVDDMILSPDVLNLFKKGSFETYVTDAYQEQIKKLLDFDASEFSNRDLKNITEECIDEVVDREFIHAVLEIISSGLIDEGEFEFLTNILIEESSRFLETGQYGEILKILEVMDTDHLIRRFPDITTSFLKFAGSEEFITSIISSFRIIGRLMRDEAVSLSEYYGKDILPYIVDALCEEESQTVRRFMISLILHFKELAIPEALKHLGDDRWFVKRNMLYILTECGNEEVIRHARAYCRHENRKVGLEAIKCLLKLGNGYAVDVIKEFLQSDSEDVSNQAIVLAGAFRIKELVPDLLRMLRKKGISGADFYGKIPLIKALGEIGDPSAVDALNDILSAKSILFKGTLEKLREEVYKSLKGYPYDKVKNLIDMGITSRNATIRTISLQLNELSRGKKPDSERGTDHD